MFLVFVMASKTSARPSPEQKQKAFSSHQTVELIDSRNLPSLVSETNKLSLVAPEKVPECERKISSNSNQKGSANSAAKKADSSPSVAQASTVIGPALNETGASAEVIVDQDKKASENGSVKDSSVSAKVSGTSSLGKTSGSAKISGRMDFIDSGKSSMCRGSTSTDLSDDSTSSSFSSSISKPHKANDSKWEAIQAVRASAKDGVLGLSHFRLLKRLGCGDIGSVYLAELSGTKCYFAMKVMDKGNLASRKKLLRAQTEREILQSLDHPFLPTLYSHFETDKFSCLVMEFCPGGDLHTLRQRQPGKHFTEQAVKYAVS